MKHGSIHFLTQKGLMKLIAIAGSPCSGKSIFATELAQRLGNATLLSMEQFRVEKPDSLPIEQYNLDVPNSFDFKSFQMALEDLMKRVPVQLRQFDRVTGKYTSHRKRINPGEYIIVDGTYTLMHASLRSLLSYSFYLESPPDVILGRRILRDSQQYNMTPAFIIHYHFNMAAQALTYVSPTRQNAHYVVSNDYSTQLDVFLDDFVTKYRL